MERKMNKKTEYSKDSEANRPIGAAIMKYCRLVYLAESCYTGR
jgi:hypothetical protein